ncbi:MAG TPA: sodium transporter [Acidobacteriota bacterium]|nr:sodium transporter [Acidobacteriota bacterium]
MTTIDWIVLGGYILLMLALGGWVGRRQHSQRDYYLGGQAVPPWQVALSVLATQVSAISLVSAPAFIALRAGGGLVWLQYEFAIPLAMIGVMVWLVPAYRRAGGVTIYEYLDQRFGTATRSAVSLVFLVSRGLGAGVALLATAIVTAVCLDWRLPETILAIGAVAVVYTTLGGIVADIYSDIIQLGVLWIGALVTAVTIGTRIDGPLIPAIQAAAERTRVFDFAATGFGDGQTFAFWPMLCGGLFLYLSYYGCDQSQTQRLLTTPSVGGAQKALVINGLLRFPLVLSYCAVGVLLIPFLATHPDFADRLAGRPPDFLVPYFLVEYLPAGLLGVLVAGIFAASMSSLDSALNSLSAVTYRDFLAGRFPVLARLAPVQEVRLGRALTVGWGIVATGFALGMAGGSETVLELVNKIGSAFYGPVLGVFLLGVSKRAFRQPAVLSGLFTGVGVNVALWLAWEEAISWLWWNVIGLIVCVVVILSVQRITGRGQLVEVRPPDAGVSGRPTGFIVTLLVTFGVILVAAAAIEGWLRP